MTKRSPSRDDDRAPELPFAGPPEGEVRAFFEAAGQLVNARSWSPHDVGIAASAVVRGVFLGRVVDFGTDLPVFAGQRG